MRQALHIFCKDLKHLWPQTAIVLLLVAAYAVLVGRSTGGPFRLDQAQQQTQQVIDLLSVLVPAAYAWLIVTLVHQEALPGNRQFWVTRPYRVGSFIVAKALFVVLFVTTSMVAKDWFIVSTRGFAVLPGITGLLLRLLAWTAWVVLPALAAGAVTRSLQEVGLLGAGLALVYALGGVLMGRFSWRGSFGYADGTAWVRDAAGILLLVIACTAVVVWQYFRRQTGIARVAVACCSVLMIMGVPLLPWNAAFTVQMLTAKQRIDVSNAQIVPDLARPHSAAPDRGASREPYTAVVLPVRVTGLPSGLSIVSDGSRFALYSRGRAVGRSGWQDPVGIEMERYKSLWFSLDNGTYRSLKDQPLTIRVSLALTILEEEPVVSAPAHAPRFPFEFSRCEQPHPDRFPSQIWCEAPLKELPRTLMSVSPPGIADATSQVGTWSYAPYPAPLDMNPISMIVLTVFPREDAPQTARELWERPDTRIVLTPMRAVAHFRRDLEFPGVRLADYAHYVRYEARIVAR